MNGISKHTETITGGVRIIVLLCLFFLLHLFNHLEVIQCLVLQLMAYLPKVQTTASVRMIETAPNWSGYAVEPLGQSAGEEYSQ